MIKKTIDPERMSLFLNKILTGRRRPALELGCLVSSADISSYPNASTPHGSADTDPIPLSDSLISDSRINDAVQQVHQKVGQHKDQSDEKHRPLNQRIIAVEDGRKHQTAYSGQGKHFLDHHDTPQKVAHLHPGNGNDRDEGLFEGVAEVNDPVGQSPAGN
jgi:hypothetical protein